MLVNYDYLCDMEKVLELYKYVDGTNDTPFPSSGDGQLKVRNFRYDAKRMGGAPTITFTAMYHSCLDNEWDKNVYASFNGERYYLKQTPTSSYSNDDTRYKHEVELVSERMILDNIYFYDVVQENPNVDKPVSNSSKFAFFGDVEEYVARLNASLSWSKVGYRVVIDEGIFSEEKQVSFENQVITIALQELYNIYKIPYYFIGKTIHVGTYQESIEHVFEYGVENSLLSISKNNANAKLINRITGVGSQDNIPYYYPNDDEKGVTIPLLNGSTSGVSISNQSKYRKIRLSDKFVFHKSMQSRVPLFEESNYRLGNVSHDFIQDDKPQSTIDLSYTFTLEQGENVEFSVSTDYEDTIYINYDIYKTSGYYLGNFSGVNNLTLTGGTYILTVRWTLFHPDIDAIFYLQVPELIEKHLRREAYIIVDAQEVWTLKGLPIVLSSYGLEVSNPSDGDVVTIKQESYINPQTYLMPPIYRNTKGEERFYNALNNTYEDSINGGYYNFDNEYSSTHPREHIETFDDIKPTIKNVKNASGYRIDRFVAFAYDENDNDEVDENNEYVHKYFFAKLRKFDGENGFNLFDHAIDESEMVVSMTSGSCGSCSFKIMVNKDTQKNTVLVDENGNLLRDSNGNVRFGTPIDRQNDTENYEVWIALEKDIDTFNVLMPNATNNYRPIAGDTFVILHIDLPKSYITAAEGRLKDELIKYMYENNFEKFNFSISFSRIFFAENQGILQKLSENSKLQVKYNGTTYDLYVSSLSYSMTSEHPLPEIKVELDDAITISQNQISQIVESTKKEILSSTQKAVFWGDIKGVPSWITSEKPKYSFGEISGTPQINNSGGSSNVWSVKTDSNGQSYIYTTYPVATQYGLTTYANDGNVEISGIYDGLPIDGQTLYWEEATNEDGSVTKVLKAKVGEGGDEGDSTGGSVEYPLKWSGYSSGSWNGSSEQTILIPTIDEFKTKIEGLYLPLSGGVMTGKITLPIGLGSCSLDWGENGSLGGIWMSKDGIFQIIAKSEFRVLTMVNGVSTRQFGVSNEGNVGFTGTLLVGKGGYISESDNIKLWVYDGNTVLGGAVQVEGDILPLLDWYNLGKSTNRFACAYTKSLDINGIVIDLLQDGVLRIDGDLVVTGDITSFADSTDYTPSTIMDALLLDPQTLALKEVTDSDGNKIKQLTVVGGTGGSESGSGLESVVTGGNGNAVTSIELSEDKKTINVNKGTTFVTQSSLDGKLDVSTFDTWINENATKIDNGDTAYGWGNHADAGYVKSSSLDNYLHLSGGTVTGNLTVDGRIDVKNNIKLSGGDYGDIEFVFNEDNSITGLEISSIRHALKFQWGDDYYEIGVVRGGGREARSFGITSGNDTLVFEAGLSFCNIHTQLNAMSDFHAYGLSYFYSAVNFDTNITLNGNAGLNSIFSVYNKDGAIPDQTSKMKSIRHALRFEWFQDAYEIGVVRTDWDEAEGFGVTYENNELVWKVNRKQMDVYGDLRIKNGLISYDEEQECFSLDGNLNVTGDILSIDTYVASLQGQIDGLWKKNWFDDLKANMLMSDVASVERLFSDTASVNSVNIGGCVLTYDSENNALVIQGKDGSAMNVLVKGDVTTYYTGG